MKQTVAQEFVRVARNDVHPFLFLSQRAATLGSRKLGPGEIFQRWWWTGDKMVVVEDELTEEEVRSNQGRKRKWPDYPSRKFPPTDRHTYILIDR